MTGKAAIPRIILYNSDLEILASEALPDRTPPQEQALPHAAKCQVALTYDDGPSAHTARLLEYLKSKKVRATFYTLAERLDWHPNEARTIAQDPLFFMGNHTTLNHMKLAP
jgi:peptidoglycan/xylan/chitin deacetylase (PgdA/CDA1 family)